MNWSDLQSLDVHNVGSWPVPAKAAMIVLVCVALLALGWYLDIKDQSAALTQAEQKELALKQDLEAKQQKAVNLEALKQQLAEMQQSFGDLLRRLPNKTEVAALLVDISQQGLGAGLEFELFKPASERPAEFYVELPIQIRVTGSYHQFGRFVSGVADLPRIVTQHDIKVKDSGKSQGKGQLVMETTAKTYRYMDEEEEAREAAKQAGPKPAGTK